EANVRVRETAQVERRIIGEVFRRHAHVDIGNAAVAQSHSARALERAAVYVAFETGELDGVALQRDVGVDVLSGDIGVFTDRSAVPERDGAHEVRVLHRSARLQLQRGIAFGANA